MQRTQLKQRKAQLHTRAQKVARNWANRKK